MTPAGRIVELRRYRIPAGQRALQAQRIDGRVAITDFPVDHDDRVYLVERHVESQRELDGLAYEYAQRSEAGGARCPARRRRARRAPPRTVAALEVTAQAYA